MKISVVLPQLNVDLYSCVRLCVQQTIACRDNNGDGSSRPLFAIIAVKNDSRYNFIHKLSTNLGIFSGHINNLMIEAVRVGKKTLFDVRNSEQETRNFE